MHKIWLKIWLLWTRKRHPDLEYFSDSSKICYARANQIASQQGSEFIDSVHLILAVLQTPHAKSIDTSGQLLDTLQRSAAIQETGHSDSLKKSLEYTIEYARAQHKKEITPLLLLYGISKMGNTQGSKALKEHGITSENIERMIATV